MLTIILEENASDTAKLALKTIWVVAEKFCRKNLGANIFGGTVAGLLFDYFYNVLCLGNWPNLY